MNDHEVPRWLNTFADMLDNARDTQHGAAVHLNLSRYMAQQFEDAANRAVALLALTAVEVEVEPFRRPLPSFRFERREAG